MKSKLPPQLVAAACLLPLAANAQFISGSTGADGALLVTNDTVLNMPPDGIFNYTTITIASGTTLTFNRNALNTPVYLLATGDVDITGRISVSGSNAGNPSPSVAGQGGPGGFDGGFGAISGLPDGNGQGPGGGSFVAGIGRIGAVYGVPVSGSSNVYGTTLLSPLIGGSGGTGNSGWGGGGGGGAILIASSTKVAVNYGGNNGGIYAQGGNGGSGVGGGGSGGAIRIVAPTVEGVGWVHVSDGGASSGPGRVRIDTTNRVSWRGLKLQNAGRWTVGSRMIVFPPGEPKLDIISAAGTIIPEGTNGAVVVSLPGGASTNQIVRVQARGFTNDVPIRINITPENGPSSAFDALIPLGSGNPPFVDVPVTLLAETLCHVHAWTR